MSDSAKPQVVSKAKATSKEQQLRFEEAARELECDDDPERFAERVRKIAKAPADKNASKGKR